MSKVDLLEAIAVTAELTGATYSDPAKEAMVESLSRYDERAVMKALARCRDECRRPLMIADVIDRLDDGHLGPEAAWAMVGSLDEEDSVVWTREVAQAFEVARNIMGDRVAARMAFLEAYRPLLQVARSAARRPEWFASLGWNPAGHLVPLAEAVALGRIPAKKAMAMLPEARWPESWRADLALPAHEGDESSAHDIQAIVAGLVAKIDESGKPLREIVRAGREKTIEFFKALDPR